MAADYGWREIDWQAPRLLIRNSLVQAQDLGTRIWFMSANGAMLSITIFGNKER